MLWLFAHREVFDASESVIQEMALKLYEELIRAPRALICRISARGIPVDLKTTKQDNDVVVRRTQGMNWIRPAKRLAIYMRDGMACVWCGAGVEDVKLTLDHLTPYSRGGNHDAKNLVTCCHRCNSSRGNRSVKAFAVVVADYVDHGETAARLLKFIKLTTSRSLDVPAARELIARRGGFVNACRKGS